MLKLFARRKDDNQILVKMVFLGDPKNSQDGKFDDLKSFKENPKLENHLKTGLGNYF